MYAVTIPAIAPTAHREKEIPPLPDFRRKTFKAGKNMSVIRAAPRIVQNVSFRTPDSAVRRVPSLRTIIIPAAAARTASIQRTAYSHLLIR